MRQKRNGCPDLPPPPSVWVSHNSYDGSHDEPGYATVREFRQPLMASTPRVRLLQAPDDGIVRFGSRKYENVLRQDLHVATVSTLHAWQQICLYELGEESQHFSPHCVTVQTCLFPPPTSRFLFRPLSFQKLHPPGVRFKKFSKVKMHLEKFLVFKKWGVLLECKKIPGVSQQCGFRKIALRILHLATW